MEVEGIVESHVEIGVQAIHLGDSADANRIRSTEPFPAPKRHEMDVRFDGCDVSSDGGLLLLSEVERRLGFLKAVAPQVLPDPGISSLACHSTENMPRQRVLALCQGYEDLNAHDCLCDSCFANRTRARHAGPPPAPRCGASGIGPMGRCRVEQHILVDHLIASLKKKIGKQNLPHFYSVSLTPQAPHSRS